MAKIARALGAPIAELFEDERPQLAKGARAFGYTYDLLCVGMDNKHMEPYILTIPKESAASPAQHPGEKLMFVLEGRKSFRSRASWRSSATSPTKNS